MELPAAWTMAEHGAGEDRPFGPVVVPRIVAAARDETDDDARWMMVVAIACTRDPSLADELMRYAADANPDVRLTVAKELPFLLGFDELSPSVITTLIALSQDTSPRVRDWATCSLGSMSDLDTETNRDALWARVDDDEDDPAGETATSGEALVGLARRHDPLLLPVLQTQLAEPADIVGSLTIEAAGALDDTRLLPRLLERRRMGWVNRADGTSTTYLDDAIDELHDNAPREQR